MRKPRTRRNTKRFQVAFSFAGEHRTFVAGVAEQLSRNLGKNRVFYDGNYEAELARPNLDTYLMNIYREDTDLIAIFLCSNYKQKKWCGLEWRAVREIIKERNDSEIMPFRFDDTMIDGFLSIDGYIEIGRRTPYEVACLIKQRIDEKSTLSLQPSVADTIIKAPATTEPHAEFTRKIRTEIHGLLQQRSMEELCKAIRQHADSQAAAEVLVPLQPASLLESFECLRSATESCVQQAIQQHPDRVEQLKKVAEEIFGWLVVLAVDRERVHATGLAFDPWQGGFEVRIPLESEAGIEVFVASLGGREARFTLTHDPRQGLRVTGDGSFPVDDLEIGMGQTDPLQETLKRIYVAVMETEGPPARFAEPELRKLRATLREREHRRRNKRYHYITVPPEQASSPLADPGLLKRLLAQLPSLRVMYLDGAQGKELLVLDEDDLWASIVAFLQMLKGIP